MPQVDVRAGVTIAYEDDWFGPAWEEPQVVVLIHGVAENSQAWRQWVPVLSGTFRVIRIDLPGYGGSTAPADYDWLWPTVASDIAGFLDQLGIQRIHLVGAKYGGSLAMGFAIAHADRVITLGLFGAPGAVPDIHKSADRNPLNLIQELGIPAWAAKTMRTRLGNAASEAQVRWWAEELMGKADERVVCGTVLAVDRLDFGDALKRITAPTLVVTSVGSVLQDVAAVREYQQQIPRSDLQVISSDGSHIAGVLAVDCAQRVLAFIESHLAGAQSRSGAPNGK